MSNHPLSEANIEELHNSHKYPFIPDWYALTPRAQDVAIPVARAAFEMGARRALSGGDIGKSATACPTTADGPIIKAYEVRGLEGEWWLLGPDADGIWRSSTPVRGHHTHQDSHIGAWDHAEVRAVATPGAC